jgi:hypothetical protein
MSFMAILVMLCVKGREGQSRMDDLSRSYLDWMSFELRFPNLP